MPRILEHCEKYFQTRNIYDILEIKKTATEHEGETLSIVFPNSKILKFQ